MDRIDLNVTSEIGKLNAVLLHKPGKELEKLTPDLLATLLFDDIPWLREMRKEHDNFADLLRERGTKVLYVQELLADVLEDAEVKKEFVDDLLNLSKIQNPQLWETLNAHITALDAKEVAEIAVAGLAKDEVDKGDYKDSLWDYVSRDYPLYINPVPNLYFMRDPAATIFDGMSINSMQTETRSRESRIIKYIYKNHPIFKANEGKLWYEDTLPYNMEGGDQLVLSKNSIAIGCSQRTSSMAIETISRNLFDKHEELKEVIAIQIPPLRAFMHLDTVFTMIDHDKFTIYPGIQDKVNVYKLERGNSDSLKVTPEKDLLTTLKNTLNIPAVDLIQSGGGDPITAAREQWNDSTNTLAIAPGVVVTYARNEKSNETLRKHGIEVLEIRGSELVRGRGGPRCMSCPVARDDL